MSPSLSAIQARDEDGRRLIRRARLHLIVRTFTLSALLTLVLVRRTALVALQYLLLTNQLFVCEVSPVLGKHVVCGHARNTVQCKFTRRATSKETLILNQRRWVNVPENASTHGLVQETKGEGLPIPGNIEFFGLFRRLKHHGALQAPHGLFAIRGRQELKFTIVQLTKRV